MSIILGVVFVQGCTSIPLDQKCDFVDGEYGIAIIANYDLTGHATSIGKFTCPQILSNIQFKIDGIDKSNLKKDTKEHKYTNTNNICCLPNLDR